MARRGRPQPGARHGTTRGGRGRRREDVMSVLAQAVRERAHLSPDALCDSLLAEVADTAEDDIALLVVRTHLPG